MCEQCTRRQFFERNALGGMVLAGAAVAYARAADTRPAAPRGKSRICVLFTGEPQPRDRKNASSEAERRRPAATATPRGNRATPPRRATRTTGSTATRTRRPRRAATRHPQSPAPPATTASPPRGDGLPAPPRGHAGQPEAGAGMRPTAKAGHG